MQTIASVQNTRVDHGLLIEITIEATVYRFTTGVNNVTYLGQTYQPLGGFLGISDIQNTLSNSADEMTISLSGIESTYITAILGKTIKGGGVKIYRYFLDPATGSITNRIHTRFIGVIVNFTISEDIQNDPNNISVTYTISVICSSIFGVLDSRVSGRRTNQQDYQILYQRRIPTLTNENFITSSITADPSMNRVITLFDEKFDFGMPYKRTGQSTVQNQIEVSSTDPNDIRDAG